MNKQNICEEMANLSGLTKKEAERALNAFTEVVSNELKANRKVQIVGFGTFEISERVARKGRNPQTGELISIAASKTPKFKPGKSLKNKINEY